MHVEAGYIVYAEFRSDFSLPVRSVRSVILRQEAPFSTGK